MYEINFKGEGTHQKSRSKVTLTPNSKKKIMQEFNIENMKREFSGKLDGHKISVDDC